MLEFKEAYLTTGLGFLDLLVNIVLAVFSWPVVSQDEDGPRILKQASWWMVSAAAVTLSLIRILDGGVFLLVASDPEMVFSLSITSVIFRTLADSAWLLGIGLHCRTARGHTVPSWKRRVAIFGEFLLYFWILLVLALGAFKVKDRTSASHLARFSASPGLVFSLVVNVGFPLVIYIPICELLSAWVMEPNLRMGFWLLAHNTWIVPRLLALLLYTGLNTWLVIFPATALGRSSGDPSRGIILSCLSIGVWFLGTFLKASVVDAQLRPERVITRRPELEHLEESEQDCTVDEQVRMGS